MEICVFWSVTTVCMHYRIRLLGSFSTHTSCRHNAIIQCRNKNTGHYRKTFACIHTCSHWPTEKRRMQSFPSHDWNLFGRKVPKQEVVYFTQVSLIYIVLLLRGQFQQVTYFPLVGTGR